MSSQANQKLNKSPCLCPCFFRKRKVHPVEERVPHVDPPFVPERRVQTAAASQNPNIQINSIMLMPDNPNNFSTITIVKLLLSHEIKFLERKPQLTEKEYKFLCPICFRYFNNIYEFQCCANYICPPCIEDINATLSKSAQGHARCCFCRIPNPKVEPVNFDAKTKHYEDTPNNRSLANSSARRISIAKTKKYPHTEVKIIEEKSSQDEEIKEDTAKLADRNLPSQLAYSIRANKEGINRRNTG